MIDNRDYKKVIKDIGKKSKVHVVSAVSDVKKEGVYLSLKYIKRDPIIRDKYNNYIVTEWEMSVIAKGAGDETLNQLLNLEFRLVEQLDLMREEEFSVTKGIEVESGSKTLKYAVLDNDDEPEENEIENGNLSYKKNYILKILFKR